MPESTVLSEPTPFDVDVALEFDAMVVRYDAAAERPYLHLHRDGCYLGANQAVTGPGSREFWTVKAGETLREALELDDEQGRALVLVYGCAGEIE